MSAPPPFRFHPPTPLFVPPPPLSRRNFTHYRNTFPEVCKCYFCQAKWHEEAKNKEIWETVRLREAKRGNFLMSWDMKVEIETKVGARGALIDIRAGL